MVKPSPGDQGTVVDRRGTRCHRKLHISSTDTAGSSKRDQWSSSGVKGYQQRLGVWQNNQYLKTWQAGSTCDSWTTDSKQKSQNSK